MLGQRLSPLLVQCRQILYDACPTLLQHWLCCIRSGSTSCRIVIRVTLSCSRRQKSHYPDNTIHRPNADVMLGGRPKPLIKEWFNCKTRMPGTVKCRPTVAYWVQIGGINIATELITRYYLNGTSIQCCFNARPTSATLAHPWTNIE